MRTQTQSVNNTGRLAALLTIALLAALVAIGYGVRTAYATGVYTLSSATYNVNEGDAVNIVVNRQSGTPSDTVTVRLQFTPVTADSTAPGADYSHVDFATLNFTGNQSSAIFPLSTIEDGVNEDNETVTVTLSIFDGDGSLGTTTNATVTIIDDDGDATYSYQSSSVSVNEGTPGFTVTVVRGGATGAPSSVACNVTGGTATGGGDDYSVADGTANFAIGATTATCSFNIDQDAIDEGSETILLGFASPSGFPGGGVAPQTMTITITDDDGSGTVQFKQLNYVGVEGSVANFAVSRTGGDNGTINATCNTTNLASATPGVDYVASPVDGSLFWGNGDDSDKFCQVQILADGDFGTGETFGLTLSGSDVGSPNSATVTINDTSGTGSLQFILTAFNGTENGGPITVTVTRPDGSLGTVTVDVATTTVGSTATANVDYTPVSQTLTFANGDTIETFTVSPINDNLVEGSEFVNVVLTNPTGGATLGAQSLAQVIISDDESPLPVITSVNPASGAVGGGTAVTITGINFTGATSVTFGGFLCTAMAVVNSTTITCNTPVHAAGTVDVIVTTPAGSSSATGTANDFFYTGGPTITLLTPNTGQASGNTIVTITGTNFTASGTQVRFDNIVAVHNFIDSTTLIAVAPAHSAGTVRVIVTTPGGTTPDTDADNFTYTGTSVPIVTGLSPSTGTIGTTVIITGSGLTGASVVSFGGVASVFTVNNDGQITATVPSTTPGGTVDVRVTTPSGTSANTTADNFTNTSSSGALVTYTLFFRFTLIVWTGPNNISALAALRGLESPDNPNTNNVSNLVGAIWRFDPATQSFDGYFPGSDGVPGANDFTTLQNGVGYFVALLNPGTVTWTTLAGN